MIKLYKQILKTSGIDRNGNTYTPECIAKMAEQLNSMDRPFYGFLGQNTNAEINVNNVALHTSEFAVDNDNNLIGTVMILDTPMGRAAQECIEKTDDYCFGPCVLTKVSKDKVIDPIKVVSIDMVHGKR